MAKCTDVKIVYGMTQFADFVANGLPHTDILAVWFAVWQTDELLMQID